jgi:hypothetical protein
LAGLADAAVVDGVAITSDSLVVTRVVTISPTLD